MCFTLLRIRLLPFGLIVVVAPVRLFSGVILLTAFNRLRSAISSVRRLHG